MNGSSTGEREPELKALRLKIHQPQAHYRIPFAYQKRHTYPIPPYSTVIGFLCNILGIRNTEGEGEPCGCGGTNSCDYCKLKKIKISVAGRFESKTTEYTWFRNLNVNKHVERFGIPQNRVISGHPEHIGYQMPVPIDILNDVELWIYLYHQDGVFLERIEDYIRNPSLQRKSPLHIGRAEDWIVIKDIKNSVNLKTRTNEGGDFKVFFWIPKEIWNNGDNDIKESYNRISGIIYRIPTFYKLQNGVRNFGYMEVKLNDGEIVNPDETIKFFFDEEEEMPVFLADFEQANR